MHKINSFILEIDSSIEEANTKFINFIEDCVNEKEFKNILQWLSLALNLPIEDLKHDSKHFLFLNYQNKKRRFNNKFNLITIFISIPKFILFFIWILIFRKFKKNKKKIKTELLVDDIGTEEQAERLYSLKDNFNRIFYISTCELKQKYEHIHFIKYKNLSFKISKTLILFLEGLIKIFLASIKSRANLFDISLHLIKLSLKYESFFSLISSDYLIQERQYNTSAIKRYIYHNHGGKILALVQKNLPQLLGPGTFATADFFFTLGKKTDIQAIKSGGKFKKIFPVGSLFMETGYFKQRKNSDIPVFDLLNIASNVTNFTDGTDSFYKNWYEHFRWLAKFSMDFPNLSVVIKFKKDGLISDRFMLDAVKGGKIKLIESWRSYDYALKAKAVCAWSTTAGFEIIGHGQPCLFMDPDGKNTSFLPNDEIHRPLKATSYNEFVGCVLDTINGKSRQLKLDKEDYCLNSEKVSEKISFYLKKYQTNF